MDRRSVEARLTPLPHRADMALKILHALEKSNFEAADGTTTIDRQEGRLICPKHPFVCIAWGKRHTFFRGPAVMIVSARAVLQ
jgi:hypothetical protein